MEISINEEYSLPNEVWLHIFSYLSHKSLQNVKLTCKNWYKLAHSENILYKSRLIINHSNWSSLSECIDKADDDDNDDDDDDNEFSKIKRYRNVSIESLDLDPLKLMQLQYLRENLENLRLMNCHLMGLWYGNLFPNLKYLDIDGETLQYEQCLCFKLCHLKRLCLIISNELSAHHGFILLRTVGQSIMELDFRIFVDFVDATFLKDTVEAIRNLYILEISCYSHDSYDNLKTILESLSAEYNRLTYITLKGNGIKDDLLTILLDKWSNTLEVLNLRDCQELTDNGIKPLQLANRTLNHLNLSNCYQLTGDGLIQGIAATTNTILNTLVFSWAYKFNEKQFGKLTERLPNITKLALVNCNKLITENSLKMISTNFKKLQILNLNGSLNSNYEKNDDIIVSIRHLKCPNLRVLYLCNANAGMSKNDIEEFVRKCGAIKELYIKICPALKDDGIYYIARKLKQLRLLELRLCLKLTERSIDYICHYCEKLQKFEFSGMKSSWNSMEIKQKLLEYIPNLEIDYI